jgi:hypothetical protein
VSQLGLPSADEPRQILSTRLDDGLRTSTIVVDYRSVSSALTMNGVR